MDTVDPITEMQRCMALVRPVGMTDGAVRDWLTAATAEVVEFAQLRPTQFQHACAEVRKEATHHGQIVPGILKRQFYEWEIATGRHRKGLAHLCKRLDQIASEQRGGGAKRIGNIPAIEDARGS